MENSSSLAFALSFTSLPGASLGRAAMVCRAWRDAASGEEVFQELLEHEFGLRAGEDDEDGNAVAASASSASASSSSSSAGAGAVAGPTPPEPPHGVRSLETSLQNNFFIMDGHFGFDYFDGLRCFLLRQCDGLIDAYYSLIMTFMTSLISRFPN